MDGRTSWWHIASGNQFTHAGVTAIENQWHAVRRANRRHDVTCHDTSAAAWGWRQFAQVGAGVGVDHVGVIALFAFAGIDNAVAALFVRFAVFRATVAVDGVAVVANFARVDGAVTTCCHWAWNAGVGCNVTFFISSAVGVFGALIGVRHARRAIWIAFEASTTIGVGAAKAGFLASAIASAVTTSGAILVGVAFVDSVAGR